MWREGGNGPINISNQTLPLASAIKDKERAYLSYLVTMNNLLEDRPDMALNADKEVWKVKGYSWEDWNRTYACMRNVWRFWSSGKCDDGQISEKSKDISAVAFIYFTAIEHKQSGKTYSLLQVLCFIQLLIY